MMEYFFLLELLRPVLIWAALGEAGPRPPGQARAAQTNRAGLAAVPVAFCGCRGLAGILFPFPDPELPAAAAPTAALQPATGPGRAGLDRPAPPLDYRRRSLGADLPGAFGGTGLPQPGALLADRRCRRAAGGHLPGGAGPDPAGGGERQARRAWVPGSGAGCHAPGRRAILGDRGSDQPGFPHRPLQPAVYYRGAARAVRPAGAAPRPAAG